MEKIQNIACTALAQLLSMNIVPDHHPTVRIVSDPNIFRAMRDAGLVS